MADTSLIFNIIAKDKTKGGFDKVKAGAAAAGVAVGAVLMAGVSTAIEKGKLDAKLSAQLGATPAQAKEIGKLSGKVYAAGFGEDLPGVSAAIKDAAQNGLVSMDKISSDASQATVKNLLTVSSVLEEDTARTSSAVSQMLRTGLAGSAEEAMDILVAATQKGINKSGDLLDTVNEYGTQFRQLGLDGPASMGLLSQAIQAGARDSDVAADALKEFALIGVSGSKKSAEAFKKVGVDAKWAADAIAKGGPDATKALDATLDGLRKMKPGAEQAATATALFGTKSEDMQQALLKMDVSTAAKQMGNLKGATGQAATTAAAGVASYGALGRQFQMALVDTLNKALPAVNAVFGFLQKNSSWVQPLALGLLALGGAIAVVTAVQWAWNTAQLASPTTWIILGIVALIGVIVLVATKTKFFQTVWNAVWGFLKGVGSWFAGPFANFFKRGVNMIWNYYQFMWGRVKWVVNGIKSFYVGMWNAWSGVVTKVITKGGQFVKFMTGLPGRVGNSFRGIFNSLWTGFRGNVNKIVAGWNNLSFGIPGFSFAGVSVPGVSIGTPNIPYLATGGTVKSQGLAYIHRGETVTPAARVTPFRSTGGGGGGTITLKSDGSRLMNLLLEILREAIRERGGDPVKVLAPR